MTLLGHNPDFSLATTLASTGACFRSTNLERVGWGCHPIKIVMGMPVMAQDEIAPVKVSSY